MKKYRRILLFALIMGITISNPFPTFAANEECDDTYFENNYINGKITYERNGNQVTFSGVDGSMVYYTINGGEKNEVDSTGSFTVTIVGSTFEVELRLKEDDSKCAKDVTYASYIFSEESMTRNPQYDSICSSFREEHETLKEKLPYCFQEYVPEDSVFTNEEVQTWIDNLLTTPENKVQSNLTEDTGDGITGPKNIETVGDKNVLGFTCDYYTGEKTKRTYSHKALTSKSAGGIEGCYETCKEVVEVIMDPPVDVEAGMCFHYVAEIRSKVECEYVYTEPKPTYEPACYETPTCSSGGGSTHHMGGPTGEFDSCVNRCDGGKYSQKCINQCYDETYKKPSDDLLSYTPISKNSILATPTEGEACPNLEGTAEEVYQAKQDYPGGYYENGKWVSSGPCASDIGYYYFRSVAQTTQTLNMLRGKYTGYGDTRKYGATRGDGILYRTQINGNVSNCNDTCWWSNRGCKEGQPVTKKQADEKYQEALKKWEENKASCEGMGKTCSNEQGVYTITVDRETMEGNETTDSYESEQKQNSSEVGGAFPSMVEETDGICMGATCTREEQKNNPDCYDYRDVLSFPKNYINNKTGQTTPNPSSSTGYTPVGNQYCTKLTTPDTNVYWYNWKVYGGGDKTPMEAPVGEEKEKIEKNTKLNIHVNVEKFGYFGWYFDPECFYALIQNPITCDDEGCDPKEEEDKDKDSKNDLTPVTSDFVFKTIDLSDVFPDREARFNWNCNGTNLEEKDYLVQPVALTDKIEDLGDQIYTDENEVDYRIQLTPEVLKQIREYNKTEGEGTFTKNKTKSSKVTQEGLTIYKSPLLDQLGSDVIKNRGKIGCNNQYGSACDDIGVEKETDTVNSQACYNDYISQRPKGGDFNE